MANAITSCRILCSVLILFVSVLSPEFYALYLISGFTDMIDGTVARKTGTDSKFGAKLDSVADFTFVCACLIKLVPVLSIPVWVCIWIAGIATVKISNVTYGLVHQKKLMVEHTIVNKVTGFLLFLFPLTIHFIQVRYSALFLCGVATVAALQEGYCIRKGKMVE